MPGLPAIVMKPEGIADAYGLRARYRDAETMAFFPAETLTGLYEVMGQAAQVMLALTLAKEKNTIEKMNNTAVDQVLETPTLMNSKIS